MLKEARSKERRIRVGLRLGRSRGMGNFAPGQSLLPWAGLGWAGIQGKVPVPQGRSTLHNTSRRPVNQARPPSCQLKGPL